MNFPLMPDQASNFARPYDALFFVLTALTILFTVLVGALVLFFAVRYRKGSRVDRSGAVESHLGLEITWTAIPLLLGLVMFWWAAKLYVETRQPPKDAMEVFVIGKQWMWHLQHSNGVRENNELHVPVGVPVRLTMISQDVIHSFFVPQFRIKQDVLPGRYTQQWFVASKPGKFNLFCAEYCGTQHSEMGGYIYAMPPQEFQKWLASGGDKKRPSQPTMADLGKALYDRLACANCHGPQDTERGPSLYGLYGAKRRMTDGTVVEADASYIRESIKNPYAKINEGYQNTMPEYRELTEEDLLNLLAHIRTLGTAKAPGPVLGNAGPAQIGGANR